MASCARFVLCTSEFFAVSTDLGLTVWYPIQPSEFQKNNDEYLEAALTFQYLKPLKQVIRIVRQLIKVVNLMLLLEFSIELIFGLSIVCLGVCMWHYNLAGLICYINREDLNLEQEKKITRSVGMFIILSGMGLIITLFLKPIFGNDLYVILIPLIGTYGILLRLNIKWG